VSLLYNPEDYGVSIVYEFEAYEPDYSFDTLVVVRELATGKLYCAADSGCSCPVPFEDHTFPTDYTEVRAWEDVKGVLDANFPISGWSRHRNDHGNLRAAVKRALA
jgi:hypothetical protein